MGNSKKYLNLNSKCCIIIMKYYDKRGKSAQDENNSLNAQQSACAKINER